MDRSEFRRLAADGLLLDGATGSNLYAAGMPRGVRSEDWILEHPDVLTALQRRYRDAGSRLVIAPTFTVSRVYRHEPVAALNRQLVSLSRAAVPECLIAGDVTTVGRPDLPYEEMLDSYREQIAALAEAGCDVILIETMMGLPETTAALEAAHEVCSLPVLCSFSVSSDGMLYFGGSVYEAAETLEALDADAVGVNCSCGPEQLESVIRNLRETVSLPILAKPNAGMPQIADDGSVVYPVGPEAFAAQMKRLIDAGATVVGGCCGTTPEHIAALARVMKR